MSIDRFEGAFRLLVQSVQSRIRAGEISERKLARLTGLSQPHMHNILAGKRGLRVDVADRILEVLGLTVVDLASAYVPPSADGPVRWLSGPIGAGRAFPGVSAQPPARFFDPNRLAALEAPFLARVAPEETAMHPTLQPGDDLLLECSWRARRAPKRDGVYAIAWNGVGYLCRCRVSQEALITLVDSDSATAPPPRIPLSPGKSPAEIVRGQVVWIGRGLGAL